MLIHENDARNGAHSLKLYSVAFFTWNESFSNLNRHDVLAVGYGMEDAIQRVKKAVDRDARDFTATEITNVMGFKISALETPEVSQSHLNHIKIPVQKEAPRAIVLTLMALEQSDTLILPASAEQLEQAKRALEIEDFAQAVIAGVDYNVPCLGQLIPMDCISVEDANEMAHCLRRLKKDGEIMKYCAALEAEEPSTFTEALDIAIDIDDYELISDSEREYAHEALRRIGADDELLDTIDGYTDFDQLGQAMMEEDGVRQTGFGLVRRLSKPFPEPEIGQTMM